MDIYDPQTLGIMVFGGFMVISAVGIALVSTFSMKETSYEEALAKQRSELGKTQSARADKKKKDKISEKKSRGKKKEDKPNGKIPESEKNQEDAEADAVIEPAAPTPVPANTQPKAAAEPSPAVPEPSPAPSPKDKKKKKVAKVEPASMQSAPLVSSPAPVKSSAVPPLTQTPPVSASTKSASTSAKAKNASASVKSAPAPAASKPTSAPASAKSAPAPASAKSAPAPASAKSAPAPASTKSAPAAASTKSAPAPVKSTAATAKSAASPARSSPAPSKAAPVLEAVTKDVPVMAVPPVGSQQAHAVSGKVQEPKKKASKKKPDPTAVVDSADAPLYLPYKALVSTIRSMVFSEGEAHRLIEILSEKAGIIQDTWHMATQKGDPVAILKKQLEEKEKQLAAEQEDSSTARNRLRELAKELSAEKSKVANVETRLSSQLSKREQEMIALQARMQASYQDHVAQSQALNAKILSLQDQLEKGPNAQLARLQQENSILRDALNQATSQAESKQNAELAKLRQECTKLTKDLGEKTDSLLAEEHIRKGLEAKVSATEKQLSLLQVSHSESEQTLQRRLEEVSEELRTTQSRNGSLQATLDKTQQDSNALSGQDRLEAEILERSAQVNALTSQLEESKGEKSQLEEKVASINSLLEASQTSKEEDNNQVGYTSLFFKHTGLNSPTPAEKVLNVFLLSQELLEKLKEAKESQGSLQAECEQYRTVLAETEGMLKHLQMSVEEEELVWKSKMANSEEQLRLVTISVCLLIFIVFVSVPFVSAFQVKNELSQKTEKLHGELAQKQQLSEEFEQAQRTITELQAQLDLLKDSAESPQADTEDVAQLKERLEKEKKLSKDLGQAATKLQQLLKASQEQLTKERDTVRTLQEHLEDEETGSSSKQDIRERC
uniref:Ribosome receptor lysine/proline rich domain-containing protein n=1 Tax=Mola mola TaxID=94237 RepID=A0A3Q3VX73_MOLML